MVRDFKWPFAGVALAILITSAMDATGLSQFSALPLLPLAVALCVAQKIRPAEAGFRIGRWQHYGLAVLHPVAVLGVLTILAFVSGATRPGATDWSRVASTVLLNSIAGILAVMLTEEGFFRGWLWAALKRPGLSDNRTLLWSSLAFAAWHISPVVLDTGFNPPPAQIPLFLVNAFVLGLIWGRLRAISQSIIVASVCHAFWNAAAYTLYGFGTKTGALGITDTSIFAPEVGVAGLLLNLGYFMILPRGE